MNSLTDHGCAHASDPVRTKYVLDAGPGAYRIGLIVLATDHATERDFMNMRPGGDDVVVHTSRVRNVNPCTVENLQTMAPLLTEAASLILPGSRLDVMAYSCTSASVVIGHDAVAERIHAARPGIPCVTPLAAAYAGFERMGVTRIAVLTPYIDEVNAMIARHIEDHGLEIAGFTSFHMADDVQMASLPPEAIYQGRARGRPSRRRGAVHLVHGDSFVRRGGTARANAGKTGRHQHPGHVLAVAGVRRLFRPDRRLRACAATGLGGLNGARRCTGP